MNNRPKIIQYTKNGAVHIKTHENQVSNDDSISSSSSGNYYKCAVRGCSNTLNDQPCKIFFPFPSQSHLRASWFRACGLDVSNPPNRRLYLCEDHFDLRRDTHLAVLQRVAGTGGVIANLLKDQVVPHIELPDNLVSQPLGHPSSVSSSGMSSPPSSYQPTSSPGGSSSDGGPAHNKRNRSSNGRIWLSTASGPKIRVKSVEELKNPTSASSDLLQSKKGRPPEKTKTSRVPSLSYKECIVPECPTNVRTFPDASFVCAPIVEATRKVWFSILGLPVCGIPALSSETLFFCTNHFKPSDLESFKLPRDRKVHVRVKHGALPLVPKAPASPEQGTSQLQSPVPDARIVKPTVPVVKPVAKYEDLLESPVKTPPNKKPTNVVAPTCKKYEPKSMPQFPLCRPPCPPEFHCASVTGVEYSAFYAHFYSLDTRIEQNEFIFSHTEVNYDASFPDTPRFKFYVDVKSPPNPSPLARVCPFAFATSLSIDVDLILTLVFAHKDRVRKGANPPIVPTLRLEPVKTEDGATDDLMVYNPIPEAIEISSESEEDHRIKKELCCEALVKTEVKMEPHSPVKSLTAVPERRTSDPSNPESASSCCQIKENRHEGRSTSPVKTFGKRGSSALDCDTSSIDDSGADAFESMHFCSRCLAQFKSRHSFEKHESLKTCKKYSGTYFNCETCGRTYYKIEDLEMHISIMHRYVCPKCSDTFKYRPYLEEHILSCSGTNELSERMKVLIKNAKSKNEPPKKKTKTHMLASSGNREPTVEPKELQSCSSLSLLRPAVLTLNQINIPRSMQGSIGSSQLKAKLVSSKQKRSKSSQPSKAPNARPMVPPQSKLRSPVASKEKKLVPLTDSPRPVPKYDGLHRSDRLRTPLSNPENNVNMRHQIEISSTPSVTQLQHHTQKVRNPFSIPERQLTLSHEPKRIVDVTKGPEQCSLTQGSTVASETNCFRNGNHAQPSKGEPSTSGMNFTPLKSPQNRTLPALNSLPDFYNLIPDSPGRFQKPLPQTSRHSRNISPAKLMLQQQVNSSEPQNSSSEPSCAQNTISHCRPHDRSHDGSTSNIRSCHVHVHSDGVTVTIQNQDQSNRELQEGMYGKSPRSSQVFSQLPMSSSRTHEHSPFMHSPEYEPPRQASSLMESGGRWRPPGRLQTASRENSPDRTAPQSVKNQLHRTSTSQLYHPFQSSSNGSHATELAPRPIPPLLDLHIQPPSFVKTPKTHTNKSPRTFKTKRANRLVLTPLGFLHSEGIAISNFSDEEVFWTEKSTTISRVLLDLKHCTRSVGSQTTLPLIASETSRFLSTQRGKSILTSLDLLKTEDGNPITNFSEEDIAFFDKAINISKEVLVEPHKRSIASQTTLPLVASKASCRLTKTRYGDSSTNSRKINLAVDKTTEVADQAPEVISRRTSTQRYMLYDKNKPIENFPEDYIAFVGESVTIAYEECVTPNKRSVASQTALPLVASQMLRPKKPTREQRRVINFFKHRWDPNVPLLSQPGWLMRQPREDHIPNPRCLSQPTGFNFETVCNCNSRCRRRCKNRAKRKATGGKPSSSRQ